MQAILTSLFLILPLAVPAQETPRLTVEGRGTVASVPDMAHVGVAVTREAPSAAEAMSALSEATAAVLARIAAEGVAPEDVQTGQLSLQPLFERGDREDGAPRIAGYLARTVLDIRARDLDGLGALIDAVVSDGANGLERLSFTLSDPRPAEDEARRAAFADAMDRAALYAEEAGMALGPIVSLHEGPEAGFPGPSPMMDMARAEAMPIAPGEVMQTMTVTLVISLAPAE
jgi:uncharacterized protein YggE